MADSAQHKMATALRAFAKEVEEGEVAGVGCVVLLPDGSHRDLTWSSSPVASTALIGALFRAAQDHGQVIREKIREAVRRQGIQRATPADLAKLPRIPEN